MLNFGNLPLYFWAEAVATTCFVHKRSIVCKRLNKTPYEGLNNRNHNVRFFHIFGCRCFVINNMDHLNKFAPKSDEGIFLGYSTNKVAYRVLIRRTRLIIESFDVKFDDYYVHNTAPSTETEAILECDVPESSGPLNIVEVNYDDLFDPIETTKLSKVLVSPEAQMYHAEVSGPTPSDEVSLNTSTSPVEGENSIPYRFTTIEVLVLEEATPTPLRRGFQPSNFSSEDWKSVE